MRVMKGRDELWTDEMERRAAHGHLSLGWWREADYDVHYHPSVRF